MTTTNDLTAAMPRRGPAAMREAAGAGTGFGLGFAALGGMLGALAASSCCVLPLVLFGLGVGGAWIGTLTALAPYQPVFAVFTLAVLGWGFWRVYGPQRACAEGEACAARPRPNRFVQVGLWLATALIVAVLAFPYLAPLVLAS